METQWPLPTAQTQDTPAIRQAWVSLAASVGAAQCGEAGCLHREYQRGPHGGQAVLATFARGLSRQWVARRLSLCQGTKGQSVDTAVIRKSLMLMGRAGLGSFLGFA